MRGLPTSQQDDHQGHLNAGSGVAGARESRNEFARLLRRSGSIGVIFCFLLVASWMAATDTGAGIGKGLREALGQGKLGVQEISMDAWRYGSAPASGHEGNQGAHGHGHGLGYGQVETDDDMSAEKGRPGMFIPV